MAKKQDFIKNINILIIEKIIEIIVVVTLICISIPAWNTFAAKIGSVDIVSIEDCQLEYYENRDNIDELVVENKYALNKNYSLFLETDKSINLKTEIIINNKSYTLDDFYKEELANKYIFTLINKYVVAGRDTYKIKLNFTIKEIKYQYIFKENVKV